MKLPVSNTSLLRTGLLGIIMGLVSATGDVQAQQHVTLEDAISIGLENNFGLQISRNVAEISGNNVTLGNAGFLPRVTATASRTESVEDTDFVSGGERTERTGARSTNTNAAVNLEWTLFDGLRMFSEYNRLDELSAIADRELRFNAELLVADITLAYFDIIRIQDQVRVLENTVEVSNERIEIEETKFELGSGSEVELLQARSDLNEDRAALLRERNLLEQAMFSFNELLSRSPGEEFSVSESIPINRSLQRDELFSALLADNSELALARMQQRVADMEVRSIRGERFPEVSLSSGYSFLRNETDGGFTTFVESTGFSIGLTARIPIFDGFNINRRSQNAQINQKNTRLQLEDQKIRLESRFLTLFRTYQNSLQLVDLEQDNLDNAEKTLDVAIERFRLGDISSLEFREAQRTFQTAENRLINAKFEAKLAEIELLQLSGRLSVR
ncbi:MAG: TolC family protein [Balneolaceae bacterium]